MIIEQTLVLPRRILPYRNCEGMVSIRKTVIANLLPYEIFWKQQISWKDQEKYKLVGIFDPHSNHVTASKCLGTNMPHHNA